MRTNLLKNCKLLVICLLVTLSFISTANAEGLRIRGQLVKLDNNFATIKTSSGQKIEIKLLDTLTVLLFKDIKFEDIPKNAYLSIPSVPFGENSRRALGINVFPEAMHGFNEGVGDWDLTSESKMTNATLAQVVNNTSNNERILLVRFGEETQKVLVPLTTKITTFAPSKNHRIKVGDNMIIFAKVSGCTLAGDLIAIHEKGTLPPI
ncbi:hypothetical protein [Moritella viscosa]|uniref:DUF5666 domain-containing protein n=1 Tax=Moritella viscosa TaxID=80854 RepID=A0ABY1H8Y0_9GAMM|nr:hypothetical protein [Moritella viscosa]SGY85331.1 Putative uncharacterized protein [Moritella viscosa]SGY87617.1 Putative uncharacterized protein [Moritella viscosa]SHO24737.1 Putative uncharacterized protein [Moritella viscosa]